MNQEFVPLKFQKKFLLSDHNKQKGMSEFNALYITWASVYVTVVTTNYPSDFWMYFDRKIQSYTCI